MFNFKKNKILFIFLLAQSFNTFAYFPINLFQVYDINLYPDKWSGEHFEIGLLYEGALKIQARDKEQKIADALQLWDKDQSSLTMLRGFPDEHPVGQMLGSLDFINDDGTRGHFIPTCDMNAFGTSIFSRVFLPHDLNLNFFMPFYQMHLKNVKFEDRTLDCDSTDRCAKKLFTDNALKHAKDLGKLNFDGWQRTGPGDLVALLEWSKNFEQSKPWLKNVHVNLRGGFTLPTGLQKDEDTLFSIPFGNDGGWGILFAGGMDLKFGNYVKLGFDAQFIQAFGNTKDRRIKTSKAQTNFFLLPKVKTYKEFGMNERFNLYFETYRFLYGLSFRVAYEFLKQER